MLTYLNRILVQTQTIQVCQHSPLPDPDELGHPSQAAAYRSSYQSRGPVTYQYGERAIVRPTGVTGYASEFQTVNRGNGYLYGSAFHGEDTTPHSDYTDSLEVSGQLSGHNWPLRFGLLIEWLIPSGGPISVDSTVAIRRFRVGFPERVNYVCCGNLVEPAGSAYPDVGKWHFWGNIYGAFQNEHHSDDINFFPGPIAAGSYWPRDSSNIIGTPETNPESWFAIQSAPINTGDLDQFSGTYNFYRENESFSVRVCRIYQDYFPEDWRGSTISHAYREVCNADGTYEYQWDIALSYYNYNHTITTSQVWRIVNPDFGAWNIAIPISGYSDGFDAAGKEKIRLSVAFTIRDNTPSLGGDLIGYGSYRFVNTTVGYGYQ